MQRARAHGSTVAVALLGACVAGIGAFHVERRPDPGGLLGFDLRSGALRFAERAETASVHLQAIGPGVLVVSGADLCSNASRGQRLYAYDLPAGTRRFTRTFSEACFAYEPLDRARDGIVAVSSAHGIEGWSLRDGRTRWGETAFAGTPRQAAGLVVSADSNSGVVRFLDPRSGRLRATGIARDKPFVWRVTQGVTVMVTQSSNVEERLTALDAATGRRLWQRTLGQSGGESGPAGSGDVVLIGWGSHVAAFGLRRGDRLWTRPATDGLEAAGSGLALFVDHDTLEADDLRTGRPRWRRTLPGWRPGDSQVVAGGGSVAVVDQARVTVLRASDGGLLWSKTLPTDGLRAHAPAAIAQGLLVIPSTSDAYTPYDE